MGTSGVGFCPARCLRSYSSPNAKPTLRVALTKRTWNRIANRDPAEIDERYTPSWLIDLVSEVLGEIDVDPAADPNKRVPAKNHFTLEDDGLSQPWSGSVYLNPPYSGRSIAPWVKHFCVYFHSGAITEGLLLLPLTSIGNVSSRLLMQNTASAFCVLERSVIFLDDTYADMRSACPFPLALVYAGPHTNNFLETTSNAGLGCLIRSPLTGKRQVHCQHCGKSFLARRSTAKFCGTTCRVEAHRQNQSSPTTKASS